jgi:diguanylate cyclase (GGDEF)-like protein
LVCIHGDTLGKRWEIGAALTIGRSSSCDIVLDVDSVSRQHARLEERDGAMWVTDLGSTNGTFVDDAAVRERPLRDGDRIRVGRSVFKFLTGENVEANYHEEIYRLVTVDGLTQVANRRHFDDVLAGEVARAEREGAPLSLILLDLDHFKRTNDTFGHVVGDAVLRQVASVLAPVVEGRGVLARTGGEEFGVIAPELGIKATASFAEELRVAVASMDFAADEPIPCTVSLGVAQWAANEAAEALYERADQALYRAKQGGRNQVAT